MKTSKEPRLIIQSSPTISKLKEKLDKQALSLFEKKGDSKIKILKNKLLFKFRKIIFFGKSVLGIS